MSEEQQGGFFSNLKNQVMTGAGVILTGLGTMFMDEVKSFVGIGDDEEQTEQVQPAVEQKQEVNVSGPEIIINIPEQKSETKTIIKEVPAKPAPVKKTETEKRKDEGLDW
jgi:hypothetical protein